jgi:Neuraminidase (sialidase)
MYAFAFLAAALTVVDGGGYFPVMTRLQDGRLAAVYRGGAPHIGRGGRLDWTTSSDAGKTWSKPQTLSRWSRGRSQPGIRAVARRYHHSGLLRSEWVRCHGHALVAEPQRAHLRRRLHDSIIRRREDLEQGRQASWDVVASGAPTGTRAAVSPYGKIVQLADGTALMAVYYEATLPDGTQQFQSWVYRSKDSGKTWTDPALIQLDGNETSLVVLRSGTVLAAVRTSRAGFLQMTRSQDGGRTWSKPTQSRKTRSIRPT